MQEHVYHLRGYDIFCKVRDNIKLYELRVYDEKRQQLAIGDIIKFVSLDSDEWCRKQVDGIYVFYDFDDLFKVIPLKDTGLASTDDVYKYFSKAAIARHGVVAIKLKGLAD